MIDYAGSATYGANVRLLDVTTQAIGGLDGAANTAHKDLADRTAWLKQANDRMVGMVAPFAAEAIPSGWLECDGSVVDRATYPMLYAVTGIIWGTRFEQEATASLFDTIDRLTGIKEAHGFTTGDAVNIKQINPNSATNINFTGGPIDDATTVYVRAVDLDTFSIHPTASDATNDLNAASVTSSDGLEAFVVEPDTSFTLPDLRGRVLKGVESGTADFPSQDEELGTGTGTGIYAHTIKQCIKFE